ncbi:pentapeptide repeat-containing protein [Streptomyces sp. ISL-94]|nr:pentapeptide repeat-containing protein [Streptomyces sp. ISL-94]
MSTPAPATSQRPDWAPCRHGYDASCLGIHLPGRTACLAHVDPTDRADYLARLRPGDHLDHRGTPFTESLLQSLLQPLWDPGTRRHTVGSGRFDRATFTGNADFNVAAFYGPVWFNGATFTGEAGFTAATFNEPVWFDKATFTGAASFTAATFTSVAGFMATIFDDTAQFKGATFTTAPSFGPLVCRGQVDISSAVFEKPVTLEIAAREVNCVRTQWKSTADLRLRYATVDVSDAVLSSPVKVAAHSLLFTAAGEAVDESMLAKSNAGVRVTSLRGVDAAHLVLTDIDLSDCLFSGAVHLDQLSLEGLCTFARTPTGIRRRPKMWPYCWTARRTLAEEHHWRAKEAGPANPEPPRGWNARPSHRGPVPRPEDLAATYRQLRKAFEDHKNEPGAADFYYGEMEMRRHDQTGTSGAERGLLWAYWLLSGYGLRALRALSWLLATMLLTVVLLMLFGLPAQRTAQHTTGTLTNGHAISLSTTPLVPQGAVPGPLRDRFNWRRVERATRTAVNSVVFRSAGQGLTTSGTYIEMASRLAEPILLLLAVLAVRGRIKR